MASIRTMTITSVTDVIVGTLTTLVTACRSVVSSFTACDIFNVSCKVYDNTMNKVNYVIVKWGRVGHLAIFPLSLTYINFFFKIY